MIYRVLSEPHVYISGYNRNVKAQTTLVYTGVLDSRGALSSHSVSTARIVRHYIVGPVLGACKGKDKSCFDNASLTDSASLQVSCRFPNLII